MQQGNAYLPEFMADFNSRFAVQPRCSLDAHRSLVAHQNLDQILAWQETRLVSRNLTVQFKNMVYQIQTDRPAYVLHNTRVTICQDVQGKVAILYKDNELAYTIFQKQKHQAQVVSAKQIDRVLLNQSKAHKPAPNHPWRITPVVSK
jgi:hypothetical protein